MQCQGQGWEKVEKWGLENIGGSQENLARKGLRVRRSTGMLRILMKVKEKEIIWRDENHECGYFNWQ